MFATTLRRTTAAAAAAAIAVPVLAVTTASAEPIYLPPLEPTEGTAWSEGPCAAGEGVIVVVDVQDDNADENAADENAADENAATIRCVTNEDGSAYASDSSTQAFADAGFAVVTQPDGMVCLIDDTPDPNPCDEWTGVWWAFWQAEAGAEWTVATTGSGTTEAATDGFVGYSLVTSEDETPAPRADTTLAEGEETPTPQPTDEATEEPDATESPEPEATETEEAAEADPDDDSGISGGLIAGLIALVILLLGAGWMAWRRRSPSFDDASVK